jgi:Flp pilus assembly protein protease CpaA
MIGVIFLIVLALIWIIFASVQDLKKREVSDWLNFSLIIFAMGFRFFYCLFDSGTFNFFYQGLIGLGIFFILGNLLYYGRMFAGGDAKLMIALGAVLPFSEIFSINLNIFILFFLIFLFVGAIYSFGISFVLGLKNFKKCKEEFFRELKSNKKLFYVPMIFGLILMVSGFIQYILFVLGLLIFILPYFYFYAKSIDETCMIKRIKTSNLTEGDWLYKKIKIGKKIINPKWDGLNKEEIKIIQKKYKIILIRQGIPFTPVFLISFLILIYFWKIGLRNPFW